MRNRVGLFALACVLFHAGFAFATELDIEIVSPQGGETYLAGQNQFVRLAATTKFKFIQIDLSRDGGATFTSLGSINNTGPVNTRNLLAFSIQGPASVNCQIRATATQGKTTGSGLSGDFTINVSGTGALPPMGAAGGDLTGSYPSPSIAVNAVTTPKLADASVTNVKINSGAASPNFLLIADGNGGANWIPPLSILPLVGAPYVLKSGDTMTGALTLNADPIAALHAATKQYVDAEMGRAQTAETGLTSNLNTEVTRATLSESTIAGNVTTEATRAMQAENTITGNLSGEVARATLAESGKVAKAGDTMTGLLLLSGNPTLNLHAATKQYVDAETSRAQNAESTLTTNLSGEVTRATGAENTLTTNLNGEITARTSANTVLQTNIDAKVAKAGDTMTGLLLLSGNPTLNLHAAPKQYVDAETTRAEGTEATLTGNLNSEVARAVLAEGTKVAKAGDTMTGLLVLSGNPSLSLHAATKQYVDAETTRATGAETTLTTNLNAEVTRATGAETTITTNLNNEVSRATAAENTKVAKAGDTMTGLLVLSGNPTANLHAATKQYVDAETTRATSAETTITTNLNNEISRATGAEGTKVAISGDTMTGLLTLSGDPTANLHAATKQYVDAGNSALNAAISALPVAQFYGDGSDGNAVIAVDTTLQSDVFYSNLTVNPTVNLNAGGYRIFVRNICTISGTISNNANTNANGINGASGGTIGGGGNAGLSVINGLGGTGGAAGGVNGGAPVPGGVINVVSQQGGGVTVLKVLPSALSCHDLNGQILTGGSGGGSNGGEGGGGGGVVMIAARVFAGSGAIQAKGGNGFDGGGGGGGGGVVVTVSTNSPITAGITLDVSGGIGGTADGGANAGTNGGVGRIYTLF